MRLNAALSALCLGAGCAAGAALAGPFDGVYVLHPGERPPDLAACAGVDILIAGEALQYFDLECQLANPVQIRDMDALLYDGQCALDGNAKAGRVLIRRMTSGDVAVVAPYMDVRLAVCEVAG